MKRILSIVIVIFLFSMVATAQQALFGGAQIVSPEINANRTVTFRIHAPAADSVFFTKKLINLSLINHNFFYFFGLKTCIHTKFFYCDKLMFFFV